MIIYSNDPDEGVLEVPINLTVSGTANQNNIPVATTELMANYPNPFNPQTAISFSLAETGHVKLEIYNTKGQLVKTLAKQLLPKGQYSYVWQGKDGKGNHVASGIYLYKLTTSNHSRTRKMMLLK
jgi:flagellar hook assembly protein FlgD